MRRLGGPRSRQLNSDKISLDARAAQRCALPIEDQKPNSGLWLSIAEIARRKGVSRQAIAERVARFEESGSLTTKPGKANAKLVNLAEFDRLADEQTSFAKQDGGRNRSGRRAAYNDAITERAQYDAELKRIELGEKLKQFVRVEDVRRAAEDSAHIIVTIIEGLAHRIAEIEVAAKAGTTRTLIKSIINDMRSRIAAEMKKVADDEQSAQAGDTMMVQAKLPLRVDDAAE